MNIISTQVLSLSCLFLSMIATFLLPCWWTSQRPESFGSPRYQLGISVANCVSGGVFIATFFVGLMPEVRVLFGDVLHEYGIESDFPVSEFVIFLGFLLALGIEQYVLQYQENNASAYTSIPSETVEECRKSKRNCDVTSESETKCLQDLSPEYDSDSNPKTAAAALKNPPDYFEDKHVSHQDVHIGHSHSDISNYLKGEAGIRLGMLIISLGVHSLFEGLALGLQIDVSILVNLVIGVAVHECLVAFAMGVNVSRLKLRQSTVFKLALIFSSAIPMGQLLGLVIGHYKSTAAVAVSAVLQGLAAGTFIHVTFFEIIPAEFHERGFRLYKVLSVGLGFTLLLVCTVVVKDIVPHVQ